MNVPNEGEETSLGPPVHARLLRAELNHVDDRIISVTESVAALGKVMDERDRRYTDLRAADAIALNAALASAKEAVAAALAASEKAVAKAETAAEKRFDSVNEFRAQLVDQATTFMPRAEAEIRIANLAETVTDVVNRQNIVTGERAGTGAAKQQQNWAITVAVAIAVGLLGFGGAFVLRNSSTPAPVTCSATSGVLTCR